MAGGFGNVTFDCIYTAPLGRAIIRDALSGLHGFEGGNVAGGFDNVTFDCIDTAP